jgi:hypothetical protein
MDLYLNCPLGDRRIAIEARRELENDREGFNVGNG